MTPNQWNDALAPGISWRLAYKAVADAARSYLPSIVTPISTAELVEALYPQAAARGDGIVARKRIFKALMALATRDLADCCERGTLRRMRHTGTNIRPWVWHRPTTPNEEADLIQCPKCGERFSP